MKETVPRPEEFLAGVKEFQKREKRDAMYKVATFLISQFWGKPEDMADALGVLLLTWNQAFYRYGAFNFVKLEKCIDRNLPFIETFRKRDISTLSPSDARIIERLFTEFLQALQIDSGKLSGRRSPVAVAKALHLLAPSFFALWDDAIARAYGCYYNDSPEKKYMLFSMKVKDIAAHVEGLVTSNKTVVKLIDEYNYARFTQGWS